MNLARLNHIFIPATKSGRDRVRAGRIGKIARPMLAAYYALSPEGRFLAVFVLIAGAFGLEVRENVVHLMWCAISGVLVAAIAFRRFYRLDGVEISETHPDRVGCGEVLRVELTLRNRGSRVYEALRVQGPLLPWDGDYTGEPAGVAVLAPGTNARATVEITFSHRGEHHLDPFYVAALVPLRLTVGPSITTGGVRFMVLPKIARFGRLETQMGSRYQPGGVALASRTGEARELVGVRPYRPGDPVRDLHHRAWARLGFPVVREYQQEYFTRFGVVVDCEAPAPDDRTLEAGISLAAGVLAHLSRGEALIDLLIAGDEIHRLTLGRSLGYLEQGLDLLAVVEPIARFDGRKVAALLAPHLDRLASVVLVALRWSEEHRAVAAMIRQRGVGCRVLSLAGGEGEEGVTVIPIEAVERGEVIEA